MHFTRFFIGCTVLCIILYSCGPAKKGLFDKKTEHEKYGDKIKQAGLDKTPLGNQWFLASEKSLARPLNVSVPHKEKGYFPADKPDAAGYLFNAKRGDRLLVNVNTVPADSVVLFIELWRPASGDSKAELLAVADSTLHIQHDAEYEGSYLIRLQPELLVGVEYTLTITSSPSLAFPVSEAGNPKIVSFWHDKRDGGRRVHEGVDITAKFRTPAVAAADGYVSRVTNNSLGGKVIFMRPKGKNYTLYYAHLDSQIVSTGDQVTKGQILGLIGKTGNAKNTVPHLHFGIYSFGGATDPLPFIQSNRPQPKEIIAPTANLNSWVRTTTQARMYDMPSTKGTMLRQLKEGEAVRISSATSAWYKVVQPGGMEGFIMSRNATRSYLTTFAADTTLRLLDQPEADAAAKTLINEKSLLNVIGSYNNYYLVNYDNQEGWIPYL